MHTDSIDKIVSSYFACVTKKDFTYKNKQYTAKDLRTTELLFRSFSCPENCGACCGKFSLDYLSTELHPSGLTLRNVKFDGKDIPIYSDFQEENSSLRCKHINMFNGRCSVHGKHPFSCDFELIRTLMFKSPQKPNSMLTRLYGRGWNFTKVDGKRGALCVIGKITHDSVSDTRRKIERLNEWCNYFGVDSHCPDILKWIDSGNVYSATKIFKRSTI